MSITPRQRMIDSLNGRAEQVSVAFWHLRGMSASLGGPRDRAAGVPMTRIEHPTVRFTGRVSRVADNPAS
jgi:hypothetical protein